ncbi:MAG: serine protease [Clostridiales bacterium]|nr:serine protease [Candidatus Equinaster intestinalis]
MDEFENNEQIPEVEAEPEAHEITDSEQLNSEPAESFAEFQNEEEIVDNNYTDSPANVPIELQKPKESGSSLGLRIFILLLCGVIAISGALAAGYFLGKNGFGNNKESKNEFQLESKPDSAEVLSAEKIYKTVNPSVVGIVVYNSQKVFGYASGVVYSEDGYIITNDHIYAECPDAKFRIYTFDGKSYNASFVAGDVRSDLAVLKADADGLYPATFGNSDDLNPGEAVYTMGRPDNVTGNTTITSGNVSYLNIRIANASSYSQKFIQTDAALNPGSSGGALVNSFGQIIGITAGNKTDGYEDISYAIPTVTVKKIVVSLIETKSVPDRAKLGISYQAVDDVTALISKTPTGLYVAEISGNPDLEKKIKEGDVIFEINGIKIDKDSVVLDFLETAKPGDEVTLSVYSEGGGETTVKTVLMADKCKSSYNSSKGNKEDSLPANPSDGDGTFDFPYGY